jgi:hypothetical protein
LLDLELIIPGINYIGIDIVEALIQANQARYANERISFRTLDITTDSLPFAELCLIRQVLQHLSNAQILKVLANCQKYKYVIITEHVPTGQKVKPNVDKPHGPDIRLRYNSGIFLDQPPFNQKVENIFEVPVTEKGGVLLTTLLTQPT